MIHGSPIFENKMTSLLSEPPFKMYFDKEVDEILFLKK